MSTRPMRQAYDPRQVLIAFGPHVPSGFPDGTFVTIERDGDGVKKVVGADGSVARSVDPNNTATLSMTLRWDSDTAAWAQRQYDLDNMTGAHTFPVMVKDLRGGLVFQAQEAWVANPQNNEYGTEMSDRDVVIHTGQATWNVAGR